MYVWADRPEGYRVFRCLQTHFVETRSQGEKQKKGHRLFVLGFVWTPGTQTMTSSPPHQAGYVRLGLICFVWFYLYYFCSFKYSPLLNWITSLYIKKYFLLILHGLTDASSSSTVRLYEARRLDAHVPPRHLLLFLVANQCYIVALNMYYSVTTGAFLQWVYLCEKNPEKVTPKAKVWHKCIQGQSKGQRFTIFAKQAGDVDDVDGVDGLDDLNGSDGLNGIWFRWFRWLGWCGWCGGCGWFRCRGTNDEVHSSFNIWTCWITQVRKWCSRGARVGQGILGRLELDRGWTGDRSEWEVQKLNFN